MIKIFAVTGAALLLIAAVFEVLLIIGLPLGEFTMGGQYKVLPPFMRAGAVFSLATQVFAGLILLQGAGLMNMWFSSGVTKIICFVFAGFFVLNTGMNLISKSKKEKYVMTPLALIEAVCFLMTALLMK